MAFVEEQIAEWKGAYRVLHAPLLAPAEFIRDNYRTLMKRWHPDHYAAGSAEQVEAAEMTRLINEAYGKIENAPLRNYDAAGGSFRAAEADGFSAPHHRPFVDRPEPFRNMERVEFWIKFGVGAVIGAVFGLGSIVRFYPRYDPGSHWGCGDCGWFYGVLRLGFRETGRQVLGRSFSTVMVVAVVVSVLPSGKKARNSRFLTRRCAAVRNDSLS